MIVSVNQNIDNITAADKYRQLFARAYQILEEKGHLKEGFEHDDHTFHSIEEYFAHLSALFAIDQTFIMLPLDGTPFAIDANKRTISNPKITVMQKDQNSTIVFFTIDRYFDYKDLDTAFVYVQWTLPDGTEGATDIKLKDLSIPGKIRLGWPLHSEVTAQKGAVKFSVRFWNVDQIDGQDVVVYSFNTVTSTLTITESLQPELNDSVSVNTPIADGYFKKAIIDSNVQTENMAIPMAPRFDEPGLNLNAFESLTENTLTLQAQAVTPDTGEVTYEWWYNPAETKTIGEHTFVSGNWYPYNDVVVTDEEDNEVVEKPGFSAYNGTVNHNVYEIADLGEDDKLVAGQNYYMLKGDDYVAYDGTLPRPTLFERYTTYTVPANETDDESNEVVVPVTGRYRVSAQNSILTNESAEVNSNVCQLVSPNDIVFKAEGNLANKMILPVDEEGNANLTLSIKLEDDTSLAAERVFTWTRRSADKDVIEETVVKDSYDEENVPAAGAEFAVTKPGWYQVGVSSTLNRETKNLTSELCKVAYMTEAPARAAAEGETQPYIAMDWAQEVKDQANVVGSGVVEDPGADGGNGAYMYMISEGDEVTLKLNVTKNIPEGYDEDLFTESLSYTWGWYEPDNGFTEFTLNDMGEGKRIVSGLGTNELTVRCMKDGENIMYKCLITNVVNSISAICDVNDAPAFIVG